MVCGSCGKVDANHPLKLKLTTTTMASSEACNKKKRINLTENDVPGASFKDKEPELFHCQGASTSGNRSQLLQR